MLFYIENHSSTALLGPVSPSETHPVRPEFPNKDAFRQWCLDPNTKHRFVTSYEPITPGTRPSSHNLPLYMHGLVVDYDARITEQDMEGLVSRCPLYPPNWVSTTFSGGRRLIWEFGVPVLVQPGKVHEDFLKRMKKELGLAKLLPGLDEEALMDVVKTFEVGINWTRVSDTSVPENILQGWVFESGDRAKWGDKGRVPIPIEEVAKEVEAKYPRKWAGEFKVGARGTRFWDPTADNGTAAIIREDGMQCFTGSRPFVPWEEILGAVFAKKFYESRIIAAAKDLWHDGNHYWHVLPNERWVRKTKEDLSLYLKVGRGLCPDRIKDEPSEVDQAIFHIQQYNRVDAALPFVLQKEGVVFRDGGRYLNVSNVRATKPAECPVVEWGDRFPLMARWLCREELFVTTWQWDVFMAWLQYFYAGGLALDVQKGQSIFIAGPPDHGKTLLSTILVGGLVGGTFDVTSYLLGETSFNGSLFNSPLWCVDDSQPGKDPKSHAHFSAMVKKLTANQSFEFNAKFRDTSLINWRGRLIVTMNTDPESLMMLPDPEISILDKISMFRMKERTDFKFPPRVDQIIAAELPYFARWLLTWTPPQETQERGRFGVVPCHDEWLLDQSRMAGRSNEFREVLDMWSKSYFADASVTEWVGTSSELLMELGSDLAVGKLISGYKAVTLGRELGKLQSRGYSISSRVVKGLRRWVITANDDFSR